MAWTAFLGSDSAVLYVYSGSCNSFCRSQQDQKKGDSNRTITSHAFKRAFLLLFLGWALYFTDAGRLVFRFQNVLAQLSVTYLVAFLIRNKSFRFQLIFTLVILLLIDLAYRFFPVEGFNHPWVNFENLGAWFNNKIEGVDKASEWATLILYQQLLIQYGEFSAGSF